MTGPEEKVNAFIPAPLPPAPPLDAATIMLPLVNAAAAVARLDGVSRSLPDPRLFMYAAVRQEALLSAQIEGTQATMDDLLAHESGGAAGVPDGDVEEASNAVEAMMHGQRRIEEDGFPLCLRLAKEIHELLMKGARGKNKQPGVIRTTQNWIGGTRPGNASFVPPPPHRVDDCLSDWETYLHSDDHPLIKAALAHAQFETIHPFLDGNGRLGRLLIPLGLFHDSALHNPVLPVSVFLRAHRADYYARLTAVRTQAAWEEWCVFMFTAFEHAATSAAHTAISMRDLFENDLSRVLREPRSALPARVLQSMQRRPVVGIPALVAELDSTVPSVTRSLERLARLGIVAEITGKSRNRRYSYKRFVELLHV